MVGDINYYPQAYRIPEVLNVKVRASAFDVLLKYQFQFQSFINIQFVSTLSKLVNIFYYFITDGNTRNKFIKMTKQLRHVFNVYW
jgi:hypothetical protein